MKSKIPASLKTNPRYQAFNIVEKVEKQQAYSNLLLQKAFEQGQLSAKDGGLMTEIAYGTISRKLTLDYFLTPFLTKAKRVDEWVRILLWTAIYQIDYLDRVPNHAIVNETTEIAKLIGNPGVGKFVNGVLRSYLRQGHPAFEAIQDPIERLVVEISMPRWLIEKFLTELSLEEVKELGEDLLRPSKASARVNPGTMSREAALERLRQEGYEVEASTVSPDGIVAAKGHLAGSELFRSGVITMQDESSMLVAPAMALEAQHHVLDACAAPGGKTTHIARYLESAAGGRVTALDIHQQKVKLIQENAERQNVADRVVPQQMDARQVDTSFAPETFDRILVDAPCSGLGLLRRKPDIKYSKKPSDFQQLPAIQFAILKSVSDCLKVGGILTYSTCTMAPEENQAVVAAFLQEHPNFEQIAVHGSAHIPKAVVGKAVQLYPQMYHTDGFFISCLRRKSK